MAGARFTMLGTGTPSPSLARQSSGYILETGNATIVIDHGGGAHHRLLERGFHARDVTHLFVSHLHSDHILDVPRLVLQRWDQGAGRIGPLKVVGPRPLSEVFRRLFAEDGVFGPDIAARCLHPAGLAMLAARGGVPPRKPPDFELREVEPGFLVEDEAFSCKVGPAQHLQPFLDSISFRFFGSWGSLVYLGDTGYDRRVEGLARGCDVLVAMCQYLDETPLPAEARRTAASHLEVARMAAASGAACLVLTHLSEQFDDLRVRARAHRDMARIFPGEIIWGFDGAVIAIGDSTVGRFD